MKVAVVTSPCECQARLGAEVDERKVVIRGWARDPRGGSELSAPASSLPGHGNQFGIGWLCPCCTRNVLRSFTDASLEYREKPAA